MALLKRSQSGNPFTVELKDILAAFKTNQSLLGMGHFVFVALVLISFNGKRRSGPCGAGGY
jgi:hypothetical protein